MTDLEISKALALAIGWESYTDIDTCYVVDHANQCDRVFDYLDWAIIGPIAERYDCFPMKAIGGWYSSNWFEGKEVVQMYADTPQKAIALAVIQGAKT